MVLFLISFSLMLLSLYGIVIAIGTLFKYIREGEFFKCFLMIAVVIIGIIIDLNSVKLFGYSLSFVFSKIVFIGLTLMLITIIIDSDKELHFMVAIITGVCISLVVYMFLGQKIPNMIYDEMPQKVESHFEQKTIKRIANKLDAKSELEIILKELNGNTISQEAINDKIAEKGYKKYNGIYCYAIEDKGDYWYIGMTYGKDRILDVNKKFTKPLNYYVQKDTLKIVEK